MTVVKHVLNTYTRAIICILAINLGFSSVTTSLRIACLMNQTETVLETETLDGRRVVLIGNKTWNNLPSEQLTGECFF